MIGFLKKLIAEDAFHETNELKVQLKNLQHEVESSKYYFQSELKVLKAHLIHLKSQDPLAADSIVHSRPYVEITAEEFLYFQKKDDWIYLMLDLQEVPGDFQYFPSLHIPFSQLEHRWGEIPLSNHPLILCSEDGRNSILACHVLHQKGLQRLFNLSGGYQALKKLV